MKGDPNICVGEYFCPTEGVLQFIFKGSGYFVTALVETRSGLMGLTIVAFLVIPILDYVMCPWLLLTCLT